MKLSLRHLAKIRRIAAAAVLGLFTLALLHGGAGETLLPALGLTQAGMALTAAVAGGGLLYAALLAAQAGLALLCGRFFCSWLCPLGATQDVYHHIYRRIRSKNVAPFAQAGPAPAPATGVAPLAGAGYAPGSAWRYALPGLLLFSLLWQGPRFFGLAEPFSLFARTVHALVQPLHVLAVNLLAEAGEAGGLFLLPKAVWKADAAALALALPSILPLFFLAGNGQKNSAWRGPRGWCNSVCPVGALLGLVGTAAMLRPRFTRACTGCGRCERACKARCLDAKAGRVEASRCLACCNCLEACPAGGLALLPESRRDASRAKTFAEPARNRRALLLAGATCAAGAAWAAAAMRAGGLSASAGRDAPKKEGAQALFSAVESPGGIMPVLPPGALSLAHLESRCTGCQSCLTVCPPQVLRMSGPSAWGAGRALRMTLPAMDYARAFCQIGCNRCTLVCPSGALSPLSLEAKQWTQIGRAALTEGLCVIVTEKTRCGACAEHCPTGAVTMGPARREGMEIPVIDQDRCIGCGACQYACPVRPVRAVLVAPLAVHAVALAPRPAEKAGDLKNEEIFPF